MSKLYRHQGHSIDLFEIEVLYVTNKEYAGDRYPHKIANYLIF